MTDTPAPAPATDIPAAAIRAAAEVRLRQYDSEYNAGHLSWQDFTHESAEVLAAAMPHLLTVEVTTVYGYELGLDEGQKAGMAAEHQRIQELAIAEAARRHNRASCCDHHAAAGEAAEDALEQFADRREMIFILQTIRRLCELEAANQIDGPSAMRSIRALAANVELPELIEDGGGRDGTP